MKSFAKSTSDGIALDIAVELDASHKVGHERLRLVGPRISRGWVCHGIIR